MFFIQRLTPTIFSLSRFLRFQRFLRFLFERFHIYTWIRNRQTDEQTPGNRKHYLVVGRWGILTSALAATSALHGKVTDSPTVTSRVVVVESAPANANTHYTSHNYLLDRHLIKQRHIRAVILKIILKRTIDWEHRMLRSQPFFHFLDKSYSALTHWHR